MIRYYCQYSYGGFKTFHINGEAHEALTQEVSTENRYGFPPLADLYFNRGGAKILYRYLDKNTLSLIIREIPSQGLDTDNRNICCAVQFIGDASDRKQLDRLTIKLVNTLHRFEYDFADMFDMRGGLYFDGDKLDTIVKECEIECQYEGESRLLRIPGMEGTVLLFVPFSTSFGMNQNATVKVLKELRLPAETIESSRVMTLRELEQIQNLIEMKPIEGAGETNTPDESSNDYDNLKDYYEQLKKELEETKQECSRFRKVVAELKKENSLLSIELQEYKERNKTIFHSLWYFILSLFGNNHHPQISRNYEAKTY